MAGGLSESLVDSQLLHRCSEVDETHSKVVRFGEIDWKFFRHETGMEFYDLNELNKVGNYLVGIKPEDYVYLCNRGMKVSSDSIVAPRVKSP